MNTVVVTYTPEASTSRRSSIETIYSIQGQETDFVRDTTDTDWTSDEENLVAEEFEPVTEPDDDGPISEHSSGSSDREIISTHVVEVAVGDDGQLQLADSEHTQAEDSDSELDYHDYWLCAHCRAENNSPLYRYCEKCFKVRKNFFPPRPKRHRKLKVTSTIITEPVHTLSQDSGVGSLANSQDLDPHDKDTQSSQDTEINPTKNELQRAPLKRRADSVALEKKRSKTDYSESDTDSYSHKSDSDIIEPLVKTASDPSLVIEDSKFVTAGTKSDNVCLIKANSDPSLKIDSVSKIDSIEKSDNLCITCFSEPKSGVFVHGRVAHICCCYKCAVKVWSKAKRCPICNRKVSNVLKAIVL